MGRTAQHKSEEGGLIARSASFWEESSRGGITWGGRHPLFPTVSATRARMRPEAHAVFPRSGRKGLGSEGPVQMK